MTKTKLLLIGFIALGFVLGGAGCGKAEGPAERAGKQIDTAATEARDRIKDLVKQEGPAERLGRHIDNTAEEAHKRIKRITEEEASLKRAERKIEDVVKKTRARFEEVIEKTEKFIKEREGKSD
jgi:predicted nuclease with TOPRIM domain